jgi:hypothetical protein
MVQGLRVVFSPHPASGIGYTYRVPENGSRGTVTSSRTPGGVRTYIGGPRGLVYVKWDPDGLVCCVSIRDLTLEPDESNVTPGPRPPSRLRTTPIPLISQRAPGRTRSGHRS